MKFLEKITYTLTHPKQGFQRPAESPGTPLGSENFQESRFAGSAQFIGRGMYVAAAVFLVLILYTPLLYAQDFSQKINRTAKFETQNDANNELRVYNVNGSVSVEGYEGTDIQITAVQEIKGSTKEVELAKEELSLRVQEEGDLVLIYIDAPFISLKRKGDRFNYHIDRWGNWGKEDYRFLFDITVKVPENTHIHASTINKGMVTISNTSRRVHASNVNGEVLLKDISGPTDAHTVNGDITATYLKSPDKDSDYQTVNGTIKVNYPDDLSADVKFKSMHGDLYTDFKNIERLQARVEKNTRSKGSRTTYRLDRFAPIRIGNGGPVFNFEVLNGDVYVQRIKS